MALKRLVFFWLASFIAATTGYYLLWLIPRYYVFGAPCGMPCYHYEHPVQYILIPCFFYGIIATLYAERFYKQNKIRQIFSTLIIATLTVIISSPFGGMLWHFHDMMAGYFPASSVDKMIRNGSKMGLSIGWLVIALSIPYNFLGLILCFFITRKGAKLFRADSSVVSSLNMTNN